jgi:hypothetical protein
LSIVVGKGGQGNAGNPGAIGETTFAQRGAIFLASATGGLGGNNLIPGNGGGCDPGIASMFLCRSGSVGSVPAGPIGGAGGRAPFGSVEPAGANGGAGAAASASVVAGANGKDGSVLLSW